MAGAVALAAVTGAVWAGARAEQAPAPPRQGTAERVGETIDDALKSVRREFRDLSGEAQDRLARARASAGAMGVEARLYGRLHWDKTLNAVNLGIEVDRDGRATLRGVVPDAAARARAVELAGSTVGVAAVTDRLTVATGPAPAAAPAP
jgi:hypothetical protein